MGKRKGKEKVKGKQITRRTDTRGKWKEDTLRKVGRMNTWMHGHTGDFILCPMLLHCIGQTKIACGKTVTC